VRKSFKVPVENSNQLVEQLLSWSEKTNYFALLHSNTDIFSPGTVSFNQYQWLAAVSAIKIITPRNPPVLDEVESSLQSTRDWHFGYLSYDIKNEIEHLTSENPDKAKFPLLTFFIPRYVISLNETGITIHFHTKHDDLTSANAWLNEVLHATPPSNHHPEINLHPRFSKSAYTESVGHLKSHIARGDIYEVNFCQEFFSNNQMIEPTSYFQKLVTEHPAPFSAYLKLKGKYVMSASPERFLMKKGQKLISQPMKGTAPRGANDSEDVHIMHFLKNDRKERAENMMITDLVRNDLSRICQRNSVSVEDLCGVYRFPRVHQMISTISGHLKPHIPFTEIVRKTFPMGSMTGAPKIKAMQLIDTYERTKRGVYSGTIGYVSPTGDFDFNVVIRTLLYNASTNYLSCSVGSAITALSNPIKEYDECLLKLNGLTNVQMA
jgi:para-aminobenzoate synthetase component 1